MTTLLLPITMREAWHLVKRTAWPGTTKIGTVKWAQRHKAVIDMPCHYDSGRTTSTDIAHTLGMRTGPYHNWPHPCTVSYHTSRCFHGRPAKKKERKKEGIHWWWYNFVMSLVFSIHFVLNMKNRPATYWTPLVLQLVLNLICWHSLDVLCFYLQYVNKSIQEKYIQQVFDAVLSSPEIENIQPVLGQCVLLS